MAKKKYCISVVTSRSGYSMYLETELISEVLDKLLSVETSFKNNALICANIKALEEVSSKWSTKN